MLLSLRIRAPRLNKCSRLSTVTVDTVIGLSERRVSDRYIEMGKRLQGSPGDHDDIDVLRLGNIHRVVVVRGVVILLDVPLCIRGTNAQRVIAGCDVLP